MITVTVNGQSRELDAPLALPDLVARETGSEDQTGIAVGLNRSVVPRAEWDKVLIEEGDEVEIIAPFAGG